MTTATDIVRLKVVLDHVEPTVMRRIEVPLGIRLDRLHIVLQAAVGWTNGHLWELRARDVGWGIPDPGWGDGPRDASKTTLLALLKDTGIKTLIYLYDFGDGWEHTIKVERIGDTVPGALYPRLIEAVGRCPPEDIGGPPGYAEFLEAIADPDHERHDELTEWYDGDFDPAAVDAEAIKLQLANLAKGSSRSKSKRSRKAA
jgi:Plasmid pRiA4b ORF-3-like protein